MTDSLRRKRWQWPLLLFLLWGFAFGIRYHYVVNAQVFQPANMINARADAVDYYDYALNLSRYVTFSKARPGEEPPSSDSFRDPGYPVFLAVWMRIYDQWDTWYAAVLLSQALLSSLTVVLDARDLACTGRTADVDMAAQCCHERLSAFRNIIRVSGRAQPFSSAYLSGETQREMGRHRRHRLFAGSVDQCDPDPVFTDVGGLPAR